MIYDQDKEKLVVYNSSEEFTPTIAATTEDKIKNDKNSSKKLETYSNKDYNHFVLSQTVSNCDIEKPVDINQASKTQLKVI